MQKPSSHKNAFILRTIVLITALFFNRAFSCVVAVAFLSAIAYAENPKASHIPQPLGDTQTTSSVTTEMHSLYRSFRELFQISVHEKEFLSGEKDAEISALLESLKASFHKSELKSSQFAAEPTYRYLLQSIERMVEDAGTRFKEGERGYALWQVKSFSQYCISCHMRLKGTPFPDPATDEKFLAEINDPVVRADFLLASRQFVRAADAFFNSASNSAVPYERDRMMAKWLAIQIRVIQDPAKTLEKLAQYEKAVALSAREKSEVTLWRQGLVRWRNETKNQSVELPEALLETGLRKELQMSGGGIVELLRVTAQLHSELDEQGDLNGEEEAKRLFLLARAYKELPGYFMYELPEMLLERAIRLQNNTEVAQRSFLLYKEIIIGAYSGSGGTYLPSDVEALLRELEGLAYGIPNLSGRV